jgi:amyloid beta precursor protein binding protein 1
MEKESESLMSEFPIVDANHRFTQHNGLPPSTYAEKKEFKKLILSTRKKIDEENFEEAEAQAYRAWTPTTVPSEIKSLFQDPEVVNLSPVSSPFSHLVNALSRFVREQPSHTLPLTSTLPDMKASTEAYICLQKMYKKRAEEEKQIFRQYLQIPVDDAVVDAFLKNSHALKLLRGKPWGALDSDPRALGKPVLVPGSLLFTLMAFLSSRTC